VIPNRRVNFSGTKCNRQNHHREQKTNFASSEEEAY